MAGPVSKRQQARNERQLQELMHSVAGNDRCADCAAKNPGWASWSFGIFLCVRCATLHRKLGTHVSKVKSLSMDSWSAEQVDNMKKVGNAKSNAIYNPKSVKPDIPTDADEVDNAMERFIRQKYELRTLSTNKPAVKQNTGSTGSGSWNDDPPPLPPKPKKFLFGFRSASSTTTPAPKHDRFTPPLSPNSIGNPSETDDPAPQPDLSGKNKPSQVFGMKITGVGNNFDQKLAHLRDMGFSDPRRNSEILKSANGNLEKAVETLARLGEGTKPAPPPRTLTPVSMGSSGGFAGISIEKTVQTEKKLPETPAEAKADDLPPPPDRSSSLPVPPQRSQSAGPVSSSNSWNPFLSDNPPHEQNLQNHFQNLAISQTGPAQQQQVMQQQQLPAVPQIPLQYQNNPFQTQIQPQPQQVPSNPWQQQQQQQQQQQLPAQNFTPNAPFAPAQPQPLQTQFTQSALSGNPFMQQQQQPSRSLTVSPSTNNPWAIQPPVTTSQTQPSSPWSASQVQSPASLISPQQQSQAQSTNPFGPPPSTMWQTPGVFSQQQGTTTASPAAMVGQQEYFVRQQQQQQQQQIPVSQGQTSFAGGNPWQQAQQQIQPQQQQRPFAPQPPFTQTQTQPLPQPVRHDKSSILALYNMGPQITARQPLQTLQEDPAQQVLPMQQQQQRSVTMPASFMQQHYQPQQQQQFPYAQPQVQVQQGSGLPQQQQQVVAGGGGRHVSNESVDFVGLGAGGQGSGRWSPDAFSGLSARYLR